MIEQMPVDESKVDQIELNGRVFAVEGTVREVVRIARVKYSEEHYKAVIALINQGYQKNAAVEQVAVKYGFASVDGFYKQCDKYLDTKDGSVVPFGGTVLPSP